MSLDSQFHQKNELAQTATPQGFNTVDIMGPRMSPGTEKAAPIKTAFDEHEFEYEEQIAIKLLQMGLRGKALQDGIEEELRNPKIMLEEQM